MAQPVGSRLKPEHQELDSRERFAMVYGWLERTAGLGAGYGEPHEGGCKALVYESRVGDETRGSAHNPLCGCFAIGIRRGLKAHWQGNFPGGSNLARVGNIRHSGVGCWSRKSEPGTPVAGGSRR